MQKDQPNEYSSQNIYPLKEFSNSLERPDAQATSCPRPVVLTLGQFLPPPGDIWQCLETFWVVKTEEVATGI